MEITYINNNLSISCPITIPIGHEGVDAWMQEHIMGLAFFASRFPDLFNDIEYAPFEILDAMSEDDNEYSFIDKGRRLCIQAGLGETLGETAAFCRYINFMRKLKLQLRDIDEEEVYISMKGFIQKCIQIYLNAQK